ncbi:hypothetical protein ACEPPN_013071 [Leptodophora sp. 'Broadleaf-Isolate-01']
MANIVSSLVVLSFSIWAIFSIYIFAADNGTLRLFGSIVDNGAFPDGTPLIPITTNGRYPKVDWQIKAPAAFLWGFGDGLHPDLSMAGILFAGAWASSWILIVLESFRKCNKWRLISFVSIWGIFQFNHSNALITPLWLALQLITSPSAIRPTTEDILIDPIHLLVLPASFVLGYVVPLVPVMLPFSLISVELKQTAMGWYQQWPLWIAMCHYILATLLRLTSSSLKFADQKNLLTLYRSVYIFALAFAALSHLPVMVVSFTASIWPSLFNDKYVHLLQPAHLLVPMNPFSGVKAADLIQGMFWLIQWDYFGGYLAPVVWALVLHRRADSMFRRGSPWGYYLKRASFYFLIAGPIGIAVGMVWERDEILLNVERKTPEEVPLLRNAQ